MSEAHLGYRFLLLGLITLVNGFFAASEAALLSVRESRLRQLAEEGTLGAGAALSLLANTERMLSVVQVGVTLASLGMGWAGEETLYHLLVRSLEPLATPATLLLIRGVSFVATFLVLTLALVVIGEVVPKNLAIANADRLAVLVAPVLLIVYRIAGPFVFVVERSSAHISRFLGAGTAAHSGHSAEELKLIVRSSRTSGHLHQFEEAAIRRLLELREYTAREVMVPRSQIVSVPVTATLDTVLRAMSEHEYSRLPVYEGRPEQIVGIVHVKDLIRLWDDRRRSNKRRRPIPPFQLRRLIRKTAVVPETKPLSELIDDFRVKHTHMAMVVDEFGTIAGLITLEDVMEQVFGEIEDEHDARRPAPSAGAAMVELEGTTTIRDLETHYGIAVPAEAGFETLAGFLLFRLGYIPQPGDTVEYEGGRFTILEMDRKRIARVRIERGAAGI